MGNNFAKARKGIEVVQNKIPIDQPHNAAEKEIFAPSNILFHLPHSAPTIYYNNTLALIKLRQNKRLTNIPKGVFRCILEYQFPKVLLWRYSDPILPI
jgi:hypothetical protein